MLLDQQIPMETAFSGPLKIEQRTGAAECRGDRGHGTGGVPGALRQTPAVHGSPGSMATRVQTLCQALVDDWDGDAAAPLDAPVDRLRPVDSSGTQPSGAEVLKRLKALPGFGEQKAKIFLALLGKQYGFTGEGWREASAPYGEDGSYRSVADIVSPESLTKVREYKKAMKAAAKAAT
ncbi:HhH-GPD-type base excision DNA repair protein [Microbacterium sp. NRRL B-14842]|uniref:HhH-GPD-type base excision DNA repair protein n=1 Tax=Microbacterium sp. NRRL B-14842 TaxID=3162881 RepID=UPI003D273403